MKFQWMREHKPDGETFSFSGEILLRDIARLNLTPLDRALLSDVDSNKEATPADLLLALEMLYRRHQEQTAKPAADPAAEKEE